MHTKVVIQESFWTRLVLRLALLAAITWIVAFPILSGTPLMLALVALGLGLGLATVPASVRWALLERSFGRIVLRPDAVIVRNRLGTRVLTWYEIRDVAVRSTLLNRNLRNHVLTRAYLVLSSGEELAIPCCFAVEGPQARLVGGPPRDAERQEELLRERVDALREAAYRFTWREEFRAPLRTLVEPFGL